MMNESIKVILIGASTYTYGTYTNIPNVSKNIELIKKIVQDPDLLGCPENNIRDFHNLPAQTIIEKMSEFIFANDLFTQKLFIYYSGHGVLDNNDENKRTLYLTTTDSKKEFLDYTAIPIEKIKNIIRKSRAGSKVFILDCCYSGRALEGGTLGGDTSDVIENHIQTDDAGGYIITSTDKDTLGEFDKDKPEEPTHFTKFLLEIVMNGIEGRGEYCTMGDIYEALRNKLIDPEIHLPEPKCNSFDSGSTIRFVRNKKYIKPELTAKEAWKKAKIINTLEGYDEFKKMYPGCDFIEDANEKMTELNIQFDWRKIYSSFVAVTYKDFLERNSSFFHAHPDHYLIIAANEKIIDCETRKSHPKPETIWQTQTDSTDKNTIPGIKTEDNVANRFEN